MGKGPFNKLDAITFDRLLAEQDPFNSHLPIIKLGKYDLITTAGLVQLAALCFALETRGQAPILEIEDSPARSYMIRSGFFEIIGGTAKFNPPLDEFDTYPYDALRGSNPLLIELTKITTSHEIPELLDRVISVLRERFKYRKNDAFDIATAASEVLQNIGDHNAGACGFVAMQVYDAGNSRFLELGVADYGVGLAATLARNPRNAAGLSDMDAIRLAIVPGTSEYEDPTRGTGLYHLLEIAYRHSGSVQIRTGEAKVRYRMDKKQGWGFPVSWMPGVQISLNLPSKVGSSH